MGTRGLGSLELAAADDAVRGALSLTVSVYGGAWRLAVVDDEAAVLKRAGLRLRLEAVELERSVNSRLRALAAVRAAFATAASAMDSGPDGRRRRGGGRGRRGVRRKKYQP
jgi:hypothetical protein